jgi:hypothetical protein
MAEPPLTRLTVQNATADDSIWFKNQLIHDGLIQGQDFEWAWLPMTHTAHFVFADAALATFYQLKWT